MQYKTLATLLFATAAVAQSDSGSSESFGESDSGDLMDVPVPPSSILAVLSTAIPTSWLMSMETDAAYASAQYSQIAEGTYPAWYSSLPESVKQWETSAAMAEASEMSSLYGSATPTMGSMTSMTGSMSPNGASSTAGSSTPLTGSSGSSSMVTSTMTMTTSTSTSASDSSSSGSGSMSTTGGSSTSTAGAPAATGGIAMSLAGAAGILGLALAL